MAREFRIVHPALNSPIKVAFDEDGTMLTPPYIGVVEPTNRCNLRCPMCPHWYVESSPNYKPDYISMATYMRFLTQVPDLKLIALTGFGEPFLHPGIFELIRAAKRQIKGLKVALTTNGTLLSTWRAVRAIEAGLDYMELSYEGPEGTARYRGTNTEYIVKALQAINKARTITGGNLSVSIATVIGRSNIDDLPAILSIARAYGVNDIRLQPMQIYFPALAKENIYNDVPRVEGAISDIMAKGRSMGIKVWLRRSTLSMDERNTRPRTYLSNYHEVVGCVDPFVRTYITLDGRVMMCCGGIESGMNVDTVPFMDIWNSPKYRALRANLLKGMFHGPSTRCATCPQIHGGTEVVESFVIP